MFAMASGLPSWQCEADSPKGPDVDPRGRRCCCTRKGALALVVLSCLPASARAQSPSPAHPAFAPCEAACLNLGVDRFGLEDGLPGMFIPDLAVTGDGLLWLHVSGLLVSFDGLEFETHDLEEFPEPDRTLRGIGAGRGDTLWVNVGNQLFSHTGERVRSWSVDEAWVFNVWQGDDGALRAFRYDGVYRLGERGFERMAGLTPYWQGGGLPEDHVEAIPEQYTRTRGLWLHLLERGDLKRFHARWVEDPLPFPDAWPIPDTTNRTLLVRTGGATTTVTRACAATRPDQT